VSDEKTSLTAALRHLAEQERRTPSEHATPGELTAYHEGTLPPEIEARVQEHLGHCKQCSDLLLDLAGFADLAPPPGVPELTDAQVAEDWQALRARMGAEKGNEKEPAIVVPFRPAATREKPRREGWQWRALAAAAMALAVGMSIWALQLRQEVHRHSEDLVGAPVYYVGEGVTRSGEPVPAASAYQPFIQSLQFSEDYTGYSEYQVLVMRGNEVILRKSLSRLGRELPLPFPDGLSEGVYKVQINSVESGQVIKQLTEFRFEVRGP
jgi:hypothetical protein